MRTPHRATTEHTEHAEHADHAEHTDHTDHAAHTAHTECTATTGPATCDGPGPAPAPPRTLNFGVLAHVDAGKTSLTERLLYEAGAIAAPGRVDAGSTRTDSGAIERRRGITVRTGVASFAVGGRQFNLIDTPGHADFLAEVERALAVLDGAVLVLSAVEGVQPQTRLLMRTLRDMRLPTLVFVNKADRPGARYEGLLADIRRRLAPCPVPLSRTEGLGGRGVRVLPERLDEPEAAARVAEALAGADDELLARVLDGPPPTPGELAAALAAHTADGSAHPVYAGSALSGAGVDALLDGVTTLLPGAAPPPDGTGPHGVVFALDRDADGRKTAQLRLYEGEVGARAALTLHRTLPDGTRETHSGRLTALDVVAPPGTPPAGRLTAGGIARIRGLREVRVGDELGDPYGVRRSGAPARARPRLAAPTLRTVVRPSDPRDAGRLHAALRALAEQDPLLGTGVEPDGSISVLLNGEVHGEVVAETLAAEFGVEAVFEPGRTVCVERPAGTGEAAEAMGATGRNTPCAAGYWATVGLRVEPGERDSGVTFRAETERGALPRAFHQAVEDGVRAGLRRGPHGWTVTDCVVTLTRSGFGGPVSTAGDFRAVSALVLARALEQAGTVVHEPYDAFELEIPEDTLPAVLACLGALEAEPEEITEPPAGPDAGPLRLLTGTLPARNTRTAGRRLPGLTRGEAVWWTRRHGDRPRRDG